MEERINSESVGYVRTAPEAHIALCKCSEGRKAYGVRMEKYSDGWKYTWAFPIKEQSAQRQGYSDTILNGNLYKGDDYNGCPYCGAKYFVVCSCNKLNCNNTLGGAFKCEWCGATGELADYDGAGIQSGGDRG